MKSNALENECLCSKCPLRFSCFTQERIFSNPLYQGLFEALIAKGKTREEALEETTNEIKLAMSRPDVYDNTIYIHPEGNTTVSPNIVWYDTATTISSDACDNWASSTFVYTAKDGEKVSWSVNYS